MNIKKNAMKVLAIIHSPMIASFVTTRAMAQGVPSSGGTVWQASIVAKGVEFEAGFFEIGVFVIVLGFAAYFLKMMIDGRIDSKDFAVRIFAVIGFAVVSVAIRQLL